jgi:cobalt-zinc-cadmium efflux system membrane fusion protein
MDMPGPIPRTTVTDHARAQQGLSRKLQLGLLVMLGGLAIFGFVIGPASWHVLFESHPAETASDATNALSAHAFRLSDRQWATLKLAPVLLGIFQDSAETDGKIAIDDDLVTPVFSPYTGRVTKLMARAGDTVTRGDPLFAVQASELAQAQNDLFTASANLRTTKAQLLLAQTNEKRQHELFLAQGAAMRDWQQSQVDLAVAQGNANSAAIALAAVRSRLRILGKSEHDINALESTSDPLGLDAETVVAAPITGTVVQRQIGLGQNIVSASSGAAIPVFLIGDLSKVWLIANVREEDAPLLHKGDVVQVHIMALPGQAYHASVTYVAASIDSSSHRLPVRAELENPDRQLKPEMLATFRIIVGEDTSRPSVPEESVVYEGDTAHVWVANPSAKTLELRLIKTGRVHDGKVEVLRGVRAGEQVVAAGSVFIDRALVGD